MNEINEEHNITTTSINAKMGSLSLRQNKSFTNDEDVDNEEESSYSIYLSDFNTYNWLPSQDLSVDQNYMNLIYLLTRNSHTRHGSMACILVNTAKINYALDSLSSQTAHDNRPILDSSSLSLSKSYHECIIGAGINTSIYSENSSDVHAEMNAISQRFRLAAKNNKNWTICQTISANSLDAEDSRKNMIDEITAYITMPPCKRCFASLISCDIRRIVSSKPCIHKDIIKYVEIENDKPQRNPDDKIEMLSVSFDVQKMNSFIDSYNDSLKK